MTLKDFENTYGVTKKALTLSEILTAVKQGGYALQYVHDQTEEIAIAAVKQNGDALRYVHDQTEEIAIAAVKQNGRALQYVDPSIFSQVQELTVSDIEKLLGHPVKVIKG